MAIRNIVFDVGNVIVRWDPVGIVANSLGDERARAATGRHPLIGNDIFVALNRGELTMDQAKKRYVESGLSRSETDGMFDALFASLELIPQTPRLMRQLKHAGYRIFGITDNVHEIVAHLQDRYDFWPLFEDCAISAELGTLKPDAAMYRRVLEPNALVPEECLFFDDVERNVRGAREIGMQARLFTTTGQAERDLEELGVGLQ